MPFGVIASTHPEDEWEPREKDLKRYIHFDRDIAAGALKKLANDPVSVAKNPFFPLLRFYEEWTKFRKNNTRVKKSRPLRFACRRDAAIFACYRAKLSRLYEKELLRRSVSDVVVAYRKIPKDTGGNKSNIDIAKEVFDFVRLTKNCIVTVVDIKSYFESLDHSRIKSVWEMLIAEPLPADHLSVFKAVTNYSIVDLERLFDRLKLREAGVGLNRSEKRMRKIDKMRENRYKQICSPGEFRTLVAGAAPGFPSLIERNGFDFGIPQGTPISDLLANMYLIDFDEQVARWVESLGGMYRRYSDDIVVVLPSEADPDVFLAKNHLQEKIKHYGRNLRIQEKKVSVVAFRESGKTLDFSHISGKASRNGLEYLGFEYDGDRVKVKNSTLSNAWRKLKRRAYGFACRYVKRWRAKGSLWMLANYPGAWLEKDLLKNVTHSQNTGFKSWTFVKYIRRASKEFISYNARFSHQTKRYRRYTKIIIANTFNRALAIHA